MKKCREVNFFTFHYFLCVCATLNCNVNLDIVHRTGAPSFCPRTVLDFWFGGNLQENFKEKWFPKSGSKQQQHIDATIISSFSDFLLAAEKGELCSWEENPTDLLALIIVLDQFSRHIYRREPQRVASNDIIALCKADLMLQRSWEDQVLMAYVVPYVVDPNTSVG